MNGRSERKARAWKQFLAWAQDYSPEWHAAIVQAAPELPAAGALNQLGEAWGLGQDEWGSIGVPTTAPTTNGNGDIWDKLSRAVDSGIEAAEKIIPAYFTYQTQQQVAAINLERAKQGLPPLDPEATATQIRVVHDVNPQMQTEISRVFTTGNVLLWGGLALGGILLFRMMQR